jgi:hypothetical protein
MCACRCIIAVTVERESSPRFVDKLPWPVVLSRQLQIDSHYALVWRLVFDLQVGHGNAAMNYAQTVPLSNVALLVWVIPLRAEPGEIAIHFLFQFEIEEHAAHSAAPPIDPVFLLLIDPVQLGVVFDLPRLHKTRIDFLVIRNSS